MDRRMAWGVQWENMGGATWTPPRFMGVQLWSPSAE